MVAVPSNYVWWVQRASQQTGIGYDYVACQINLESGFNPGAVSPAGAEGIAQFLPSTFASYASGSPFNVNDALTAYINFMNALLQWSGGDLYRALAAYNAGQGNWQAGEGYAQTIISCAGGGSTVVAAANRYHQATAAIEAQPAPARSPDDHSGTVVSTSGWFHDLGFHADGRAAQLERLW